MNKLSETPGKPGVVQDLECLKPSNSGRLADELGKTVILVLHEINLAAFYSDFICAFKNGKVAAFGPVDDVMTPETLEAVYDVPFEIHRIEGRPLAVYH